jgi:hypothetical protein
MIDRHYRSGGFDPDCDARHIGKVAKQESIMSKQLISPFTSLPSEPIDETGKYPYLIIRLMATVYQRHQITVYRGEPFVEISHSKNLVQHPEPITEDGVITSGCRTLILNAVLEAVKSTGFRMAVIWGEKEVSYVEKDGSIEASTVRPSGGVPLPNKIAYDQREIIDLSKEQAH